MSCRQQEQIHEGIWVEPIPGLENQVQGFNLKTDGTCSSINMSTLKFEEWKVDKNKLILTGKSIGNKQILPFSDTLIIKEVSEEKLILQKKDLTLTYNKVDDQIYGQYSGVWCKDNYPIIQISLSSYDTYIIKEYYGDGKTDNKGLTYITKAENGILTAIAPDSAFYKHTKPSFKFENGEIIFTSGVGTVRLKRTDTSMPNVDFKVIK